MPLPPKIDHSIGLAEARKFTGNFQKRAEQGAINGGLIWKEAVEKVINQPGCVAMRYYHGRTDAGAPVLVLVGVDKQGRDMTEGFIAEKTMPCPPLCGDVRSPLLTSYRRHRRIELRNLPLAKAEPGTNKEKRRISVHGKFRPQPGPVYR